MKRIKEFFKKLFKRKPVIEIIDCKDSNISITINDKKYV